MRLKNVSTEFGKWVSSAVQLVWNSAEGPIRSYCWTLLTEIASKCC